MYFVCRPTPEEAAQWRESLERVLNNSCRCTHSPTHNTYLPNLNSNPSLKSLPDVTEQICVSTISLIVHGLILVVSHHLSDLMSFINELMELRIEYVLSIM